MRAKVGKEEVAGFIIIFSSKNCPYVQFYNIHTSTLCRYMHIHERDAAYSCQLFAARVYANYNIHSRIIYALKLTRIRNGYYTGVAKKSNDFCPNYNI